MTEFAYFQLDVRKKTILSWRDKHPNFLLAYKKAKYLQWKCWYDRSMSGEYKSPYTIFAGKNMFGWGDSVQLTGDSEKPIEISVKWQK